MPRQTLRSSELEDEILRRLSEGEPLAVICREEGKPHITTWLNWCHADEVLAIAYARAREAGEEYLLAECKQIADDGHNDWMEKHGKEGELLGYQLNGEHVQRSKLRIETRLKLLAKWNPKKWGEKVDVTSGGEQIKPADTTDAAARIAAMLAAARQRKGEDPGEE